MKILLRFFLGLCIFSLYGCGAAYHYKNLKGGDLEGKITLKWKKPDIFLYEPDSESPLTYKRQKDGDVIQPKEMYTDGGSIPRVFRAFKNYSPWGYAPAFIIHDWLFHMQHCEEDGYKKYTLESSAEIMSEIMKVMMESEEFGDFGDKDSIYFMNLAVKSPIAKDWWENGKCKIKPRSIVAIEPQWDAEVVIEFNK